MAYSDGFQGSNHEETLSETKSLISKVSTRNCAPGQVSMLYSAQNVLHFWKTLMEVEDGDEPDNWMLPLVQRY